MPETDDDRAAYIATFFAIYANYECKMIYNTQSQHLLQLFNEQHWLAHKHTCSKLVKKVAIIEVLNAIFRPTSYFSCLVRSQFDTVTDELELSMRNFIVNNIQVFPLVSNIILETNKK